MASQKSFSWDTLAWVLVVLGALNWGLMGLFKFDAVAWVFHPFSFITRLVYVAIGVSAVYLLVTLNRKKS